MKKLLIAGFAAASALALGAAEYCSISFSTVGPDKYADGETVLDGECYALVAAVGGFDGFNVDGTTKDANDKVLVALPFAKGGKCEPVIFNIDASLIPAGSELGIYLLDTRKFLEGAAQVQGLKDGKLAFVNAFERIDAEIGVSTLEPTVAESKSAVEGKDSVQSALPADIENPVITNLEDFGDTVVVTADKTDPRVNYRAVGGATPTSTDVFGETKLGGGENVKFAFPKNGKTAAFIRLIRK